MPEIHARDLVELDARGEFVHQGKRFVYQGTTYVLGRTLEITGPSDGLDIQVNPGLLEAWKYDVLQCYKGEPVELID